MTAHKSRVHHHISLKVLIFIGIFFLTAVFALWYAFSTTPLLRQHFQQLNNPSCTLEAKVCPDGSTVGRSGPGCEFAPCDKGNTTSLTDEEKIFKKAYPLVSWTASVPATLTYSDFSLSTNSASVPVILSRVGKGKIKSMADCYKECENKELKKLGWIPDMNQAADSPTSSQWGYKRIKNGKTQLLQVTYKNNSAIISPNQPIEILCPCSLEYELKITASY